jgi:MerR family transcriptional regulator, light-induced transcriptional regulator
MGKYSIKELEHLSGIKAHTIRIWEKRHNLVQPERTPTNIRLYSDEDLKKIINVSVLNNHGIKISFIADMTLDEINRKVLELSETKSDAETHIHQLIVAMMDLEEEKFEKALSTLIIRFGFERLITEIIYPFLEKIGILWQTKNINPAQEHFISNLIRQKLIVAIDSLPIPAHGSKKAVLFLPEHEMHELGLLFFHYQTRKNGYRTYYLGQKVPHEDLIQVINTVKPQLLITYITTASNQSTENYLQQLATDFPQEQILVSGYQTIGLRLKNSQNITLFSNSLKLKELI